MSKCEQAQVSFWCWFYRWFGRTQAKAKPTTELARTRHPMWDTEYVVHPSELLRGSIGFEDVSEDLLPLLRTKQALILQTERYF